MSRAQIAEAGEAKVVYTGCKTAPITFPGEATGKNYQFCKDGRIQMVKEPDVEGLLRIGLFRRA